MWTFLLAYLLFFHHRNGFGEIAELKAPGACCGREGIPWDLVFAPERMEEWLKRISKNILWGCFA